MGAKIQPDNGADHPVHIAGISKVASQLFGLCNTEIVSDIMDYNNELMLT